MACNGYVLFSRLLRRMFERDRRLPVVPVRTVHELSERLSTLVWSSDPIGGLVDWIASPEHIQWRITHGRSFGDCDEFASYAAAQLRLMGRHNVHVMNVCWLDANGRFHGHNVAVWLTHGVGWRHIGNWWHGRAVGPFMALERVALDIARGGAVVGWGLLQI